MTTDYFGAANDLIGGVSSYLSGNAIASGARKSAAFYTTAAQYSTLETGLKEAAVRRTVEQSIGSTRAGAGASGLAMSGNMIDVVRSSAQQGGISQAVTQLQGDINTKSYMALAAAEAAKAQAASASALTGGISGILSAASLLTLSDTRLKTDIKLVEWLSDRGFGLYQFRYKNGVTEFIGVLAQEVEKVRVDCVSISSNGYRMVDYGRLGISFRQAGVV
jgi:hypothetical protein